MRGHKVTLETKLAVSANAAAQPRAHLRLREGDTISVDMAIKGIVVCSANDAAVAVAEALGSTELNFSDSMNAKAHQLGMAHSFFHNATGLPDDKQLTTAEDMSRLARHLVYDFPEYFAYFRTTQMTWRGDDYSTHNALIGHYDGADGIKTGYIEASGYNLVATATQGGTRLIAVVMGGLTAEKRDEATIALLDATFERLPAKTVQPLADPGRSPARHKKRDLAMSRSPPNSVASTMTIALAILGDPGSLLVWVLAVTASETAKAGER